MEWKDEIKISTDYSIARVEKNWIDNRAHIIKNHKWIGKKKERKKREKKQEKVE